MHPLDMPERIGVVHDWRAYNRRHCPIAVVTSQVLSLRHWQLTRLASSGLVRSRFRLDNLPSFHSYKEHSPHLRFIDCLLNAQRVLQTRPVLLSPGTGLRRAYACCSNPFHFPGLYLRPPVESLSKLKASPTPKL